MRLGPYVGEWCSGVFCHDQEMSRYGEAFSHAGVVAFYAGMIAAAAAVMMVVARRDRIAVMAYSALGALAVTTLAGIVVASMRVARGGETWELGPGLPLFFIGAALAIAGCVIAMRRPTELAIPTMPRVAAALVIISCIATGAAIATKGFWHWTWSDERNQVGLTSTERCWVHPSRTICSNAADVAEIFMLDRDDKPRFVALARQTHGSAIATIILALLALVTRWARFREVGHAPWVVVALLGYATARLTPDVGSARDIHLGYGFVLLALGCLLGIAGNLLAVQSRTSSGT